MNGPESTSWSACRLPPTNAKVIRTAARIAGAFNAEFSAVLVETGELKDNEAARRGTEENIALAKQFKASVAVLSGDDIAGMAADYAREIGATKIVIGRAVKQGGLFRVKPDLIDRLICRVPGMDIYVIPDSGAAAQKKKRRAVKKPALQVVLADSVKGVFFLAAATILGIGVEEAGLGQMNVVMIYMMSVVLTSYFARFFLSGAVASWVLTNCHRAGKGTGTLSGAAGHYVPVAFEETVYAVLGIQMGEAENIPQNSRNVLHVIVNEAAINIRSEKR